MLPELHAIKVLFYAESVGMVTLGHMTKMAVSPFDPPSVNHPPWYMQNSLLYIL